MDVNFVMLWFVYYSHVVYGTFILKIISWSSLNECSILFVH